MKLYLLQGAPASGKSTFIKQNNLQDITLSSDDFRALMQAKTPMIQETADFDHIALTQRSDYEKETWELFYHVAEQRLAHGEPLILDSTLLSKGAFQKPRELAKKYNYDLVIIDFMAPLFDSFNASFKNLEPIINELTFRDSQRPIDQQVGRHVIEKFTKRYASSADSRNVKVITPAEFIAQNQALTIQDFNEFKRLKIIGDIHGDLGSLLKVFDDHQRGDAYIFVGDYLDRGGNNHGVVNFINKLHGKNLFFLEGNHERHIRDYLAGRKITSGEFKNNTLPQLLRHNVTDEQLQDLVDRLQEVLVFNFKGDDYVVTHAGLEPARLQQFMHPASPRDAIDFAPKAEFVKGLHSATHDPYQFDVDQRYENSYPTMIQIHGHRNAFNHAIDDFNKTFNLTDPKNGDNFRYLVIDEFGIAEKQSIPRVDVQTFVQKVTADPDIKSIQSDLGDGIIAHNFTREVFQSTHTNKPRWTPLTTAARGLFTKNDQVIGRGFEKFFTLGEIETADESIAKFTYPVYVQPKFNGYLALAFMDGDRLVITNKSGRENSYNTLKIAQELVNKDKDLLEKLKYVFDHQDDVTVALEVIAPESGDTHIVEYQHDQVKPLAVIDNHSGLPIHDFDIALDIKFLKLHNETEVRHFIQNVQDDNQDTTEGYVLTGLNGFHLKLKTNYYLAAKEVRGALYKSTKSHNWRQSHAEDMYQAFTAKNLYTFDPNFATRWWNNKL